MTQEVGMIVDGVLDHGAMSAIRIRESGAAIGDRLEVILTASACGQGVGYNNAPELSRLAGCHIFFYESCIGVGHGVHGPGGIDMWARSDRTGIDGFRFTDSSTYKTKG